MSVTWIAGGLGGFALVTDGLGDEAYDVGSALYGEWYSPFAFQEATGTRDEFAIMRSLEPRRQSRRRQRRRTGG